MMLSAKNLLVAAAHRGDGPPRDERATSAELI